MIRKFSAFSGYDSQLMPAKKYGFEMESVGTSEIDENVIIACAAIHYDLDVDFNYPDNQYMIERLISRNIGLNFKTGKTPWENMRGKRLSKKQEDRVKRIFKACILTKNFGDISRVNPEQIPDHDLFTYSFPCQDISTAGLQKGLEEGSGSRSSLLWECRKVIEYKKPKYLMMENVKNLVGKQHKADFDKWLNYLEGLGYNNYWKVINAKNCGVPQNRERVFCVSILKEHDNFGFHFYADFDSGIKLKDILEDNVDEKYYLSEEKTKGLIESLEANGYNGYNGYKRNYECEGSSYCIDANYHKGTSIGNIGKARRTHVVEKSCIDKLIKNTRKIEIANCVTAREDRGISNRGGEGTAVIESNNLDMVGMLDIKGNESIRRVCPALTTMQGGNRQPKIVEACAIRGRNPINPKSRESGLPTQQMLEVSKNPDINNCLTTVQKDTMLLESQVLRPVRTEYGKQIRKAYEAGRIKESRHNMRVHEPRKDGVSNTITTVQKDNYLLEQPQFRIRKLSPVETFRLMGVSEEDIKKIQSTGISNSQQYKMAGNSIVVDCMKFLEQLK